MFIKTKGGMGFAPAKPVGFIKRDNIKYDYYLNKKLCKITCVKLLEIFIS